MSVNIIVSPSLNTQQTGQVKNNKKHCWKFVSIAFAKMFIELVASGLDT